MIKWRKLYKEAVEEVNLKKLLKQNGITKFPPSTDVWKDSISWYREETGFTGEKHIWRMAKQLEGAGWKKITSDDVIGGKFVSPDGKVVATLDRTYVRTKKYYSITFKCANAMNESVDDEKSFKKLLKQNGVTKLPSGTQFKSDRIRWSKDGGYAGQKTLDKVCSQLEDAGWKRGEWRTGGVPDGSAVTNSNAYTSPDGQIVMTYSEHYGATAHDNFYGFTFKLAGTGVNESSRFGFNVGDEVELTSDVEPNRFSDRGAVPAGTIGEVVAVDKPMRGVIKVKLEDGTVVSVPERKLKFAGTDNEPWEKFKKPAKPRPSLKEILDKHGPEEIYMEPAKPGSPKWTGD